MSNLPADWLEKSARDAAKGYKGQKVQNTVSDPTKETSVSPLGKLIWHSGMNNTKHPRNKHFIALVRMTRSANIVIKLYIHKDSEPWMNALTGDRQVPYQCCYWAEVPDDFVMNFPIPVF